MKILITQIVQNDAEEDIGLQMEMMSSVDEVAEELGFSAEQKNCVAAWLAGAGVGYTLWTQNYRTSWEAVLTAMPDAAVGKHNRMGEVKVVRYDILDMD